MDSFIGWNVAYDTLAYITWPGVGQSAMAAECPVCGTYVDEAVPTADTEYDGDEYVFESAKCKELFKETPGEYI
jgi:YHS domain-containing protein